MQLIVFDIQFGTSPHFDLFTLCRGLNCIRLPSTGLQSHISSPYNRLCLHSWKLNVEMLNGLGRVRRLCLVCLAETQKLNMLLVRWNRAASAVCALFSEMRQQHCHFQHSLFEHTTHGAIRWCRRLAYY